MEITIADNGERIAPKHLPHLYEHFYRGDSSRSQKQRGSGPGLSIAKGLSKAQSGRISIASQVRQELQLHCVCQRLAMDPACKRKAGSR